MTADVIPFPIKPRAAGERPSLPCSSFRLMVPVECLRPFSEVVDAQERANDLLELFSKSDA
jgi:hypothetical protein